MLNNNLSSLIISGFPAEELLSNAWESILQDYSDILGMSEHRMYINLMKEIELLKIDYESIVILVSSLRKTYSKYFCDELNQLLRTNCRFNINDEKSYLAELDKCERRSKILRIKLDLKSIEFEAIKEKMSGKGNKIDKNYFTSVLIILSRHNGYQITKDIFVNEYVEHIKQFNKYCEEMDALTKKK